MTTAYSQREVGESVRALVGRRALFGIAARFAPAAALATPLSRVLLSPAAQTAEQQVATHPAIVGEFAGEPVYDYALVDTIEADAGAPVFSASHFVVRAPGQMWANAVALPSRAITVMTTDGVIARWTIEDGGMLHWMPLVGGEG